MRLVACYFATMCLGLGFPAAAEVKPHQSLKGTRSLGDLIEQATAGRPVHVIFVHGMRAEGPGASVELRKAICQQPDFSCRSGDKAPDDQYVADLGSAAPAASLYGKRIWTDAQWIGSRPFVDRYHFKRHDGVEVIVDEVNWWPLLFPLKCRYLLLPEIELSGPDEEHLERCARAAPPFHPWTTKADVEARIANAPRHAKGAWANRMLKAQIMNWGLADAVITLGPMRAYFHQTMEQAFAYAGRSGSKGETFVIVSESLGSFVVMDAFASSKPTSSVRDVMQRTYDLYFFANQFALLELARIEGLDSGAVPLPIKASHSPDAVTVVSPVNDADSASIPAVSPFSALREWASPPRGSGGAQHIRQIIAFNDPNDALTYEVPEITGAQVVNVYDWNSWHILGLFADPIGAHVKHSKNKSVIKLLFERRKPLPR
ncbi:hypothetical protein [Caulobacter segnis]|uniref:hypothetical protein n=1 Tax=Caulobacter segnis TaxID=88688 RepID=UPI001CC01ED9|nr:hypothetical protein [Caulobacter segnis]UAL10105.1 hypothetical protein K8940_20420 [Caulobacter segnis]